MTTKPRKGWAGVLVFSAALLLTRIATSDPLDPVDHDVTCPTCTDPDIRTMTYVRYALDRFNEQHPGATFIGGLIPGWINYKVAGASGDENDWVLVALSREPDLGNVLGLDGDVLYEAVSTGGVEQTGTFQAGHHFSPPGDDDGSGGGSGGGGSGGGDCGDDPEPLP